MNPQRESRATVWYKATSCHRGIMPMNRTKPMNPAVKIMQISALCVVVVAICVLSIWGKLAGEAATILGAIAGYLSNWIREDRSEQKGKPE